MNVILFDLPGTRKRLLPLTYTRPVASLLTGLSNNADKWSDSLGQPVSFLTEMYLQEKFKLRTEAENLLINGALSPDQKIRKRITGLKINEGLFHRNIPLALKLSEMEVNDLRQTWDFTSINKTDYPETVRYITDLTHIYNNAGHITNDFNLVPVKNPPNPGDKHTVMYNADLIHIGKDCSIRASILDATEGPVFIGNKVVIQPGTVIRGPAAILDGSVISPGTKIRPATTIGPGCHIGGEVSHVVFQGYSNKSHDGFIGSSVIGEWCNLGAGTTNSNLKNNYGTVKLWDYASKRLKDTGLMYCGLMMGDHSKCGINTMFNTGTVVGVSANIFGGGFMPKFIPSFSWGGEEGFTTHNFDKAVKTAKIVMERRSQLFTEADGAILKHVYQQSLKFRGGIKSV